MDRKKKMILGTLVAALVVAAGILFAIFGKKKVTIGGEPAVVEHVTVTIPGMQGEVKLLYLSDLHIITFSDEIAEEDLETVSIRGAQMSRNGIPAETLWWDWVEYLNAADADYLLFGADMVDFASEKNIAALKKGMDRLETPYMYIRADHDSVPNYLTGVTREDSRAWQDAICDNSDVMVQEFEDFLILGWNNSIDYLTSSGLEKVREACATGKPIILLTHVPIEPLADDSLATASQETYGGHALIWGYEGGDSFYSPDANTLELLELIYSQDSPIKEVLCGHLHFTWDGYVTDTVHQHVFGPAFSGTVGVVTVKGE